MKDTRKKIFESATELFSYYGYSAVTTKQIAAGAGISEVTLFRHFPSKRSIFMEIVSGSVAHGKLQEYVKQNIELDIDVDIKNISYIILSFYRKNVRLIRMIFKDSIHDSSENFIDYSNKIEWKILYAYFAKMKDKGLLNDDPKKLCMFYLSNIKGFIFRNYIFENKLNDTEDFDWLVNKVIEAIKL